MSLLVDLVLPVITVLVTLRTQVSNWFGVRVQRPVNDLTVGPSVVAFDDLTSEFNKEEVRQHDYYDRRKKKVNEKGKMYMVDDADAADNMPKDKYANDALEGMFSQVIQSGKCLDTLFLKDDENEANASGQNSNYDQNSSSEKPKIPAAELPVELMLSREVEARKLYSLYKMPPSPPKNCDRISLSDSGDSHWIFSWPQWITDLRNKTSLFRFTNPFKRQSKTNKEILKEGATTEDAGKKRSKESKRDNEESKNKRNTRRPRKNPLRKLAAKCKKQKEPSLEQTSHTIKEDDQDNKEDAENCQGKQKPLFTPATLYGRYAMAHPKCKWGHDDCEYMEEKIKALGLAASQNHQPSRPVEPVQRVQPRPHGTNGPVPTPKKIEKGKCLSWLTSKSKKASRKSEMNIAKNQPLERSNRPAAVPRD